MSLTRRMLKAMGIDEEKIDQIIEAHAESVDALKEKAEKYEADSKTLVTVQKELDDLKKGGGDWKEKYEKEHKDFTEFKNALTAKETKAAKEKAYRDFLKNDVGVHEKHIDLIVRGTNLDEVVLDGDKIKDAESRKEAAKKEFADYITHEYSQGVKVSSPPENTGKGSGMTKEQILAIRDTSTRHKTMLENAHLFPELNPKV